MHQLYDSIECACTGNTIFSYGYLTTWVSYGYLLQCRVRIHAIIRYVTRGEKQSSRTSPRLAARAKPGQISHESKSSLRVTYTIFHNLFAFENRARDNTLTLNQRNYIFEVNSFVLELTIQIFQ